MEGVKALLEVLSIGGPTAMAAVFALAWFLERRENKQLQKSLLELATAQVQAITKIESTVAALKDSATQALNRY